MKDAFYFLHHGETDWNVKGILMGQQDIPLNDHGRQQAEEAGKVLAGLSIATLCHSPLKRAKETAQLVTKHCPCSLHPMDSLMERGWGIWEGHSVTHDQLENSDDLLPEGAESKIDFRDRVIQGMEQSAQFPAPVLLVAHSGVFSIICSELQLECPLINNTDVAYFFQQLGKWCVDVIHQ